MCLSDDGLKCSKKCFNSEQIATTDFYWVYYEELCETRIILSLLQHLQLQITKHMQHDCPLVAAYTEWAKYVQPKLQALNVHYNKRKKYYISMGLLKNGFQITTF